MLDTGAGCAVEESVIANGFEELPAVPSGILSDDDSGPNAAPNPAAAALD